LDTISSLYIGAMRAEIHTKIMPKDGTTIPHPFATYCVGWFLSVYGRREIAYRALLDLFCSLDHYAAYHHRVRIFAVLVGAPVAKRHYHDHHQHVEVKAKPTVQARYMQDLNRGPKIQLGGARGRLGTVHNGANVPVPPPADLPRPDTPEGARPETAQPPANYIIVDPDDVTSKPELSYTSPFRATYEPEAAQIYLRCMYDFLSQRYAAHMAQLAAERNVQTQAAINLSGGLNSTGQLSNTSSSSGSGAPTTANGRRLNLESLNTSDTASNAGGVSPRGASPRGGSKSPRAPPSRGGTAATPKASRASGKLDDFGPPKSPNPGNRPAFRRGGASQDGASSLGSTLSVFVDPNANAAPMAAPPSPRGNNSSPPRTPLSPSGGSGSDTGRGWGRVKTPATSRGRGSTSLSPTNRTGTASKDFNTRTGTSAGGNNTSRDTGTSAGTNPTAPPLDTRSVFKPSMVPVPSVCILFYDNNTITITPPPPKTSSGTAPGTSAGVTSAPPTGHGTESTPGTSAGITSPPATASSTNEPAEIEVVCISISSSFILCFTIILISVCLCQ
jgi:hypothetical protein